MQPETGDPQILVSFHTWRKKYSKRYASLICLNSMFRWEIFSLWKHPFLLALHRWARFARNVPSGKERDGKTDVFAGPFPTRPPEGSNWRGHPDLCFTHQALDHFRVTPGLCIKTRLSAQPLIRKWVFILLQIEIIFTSKDVPFKTRKWPITVTPVEELFKERILIL